MKTFFQNIPVLIAAGLITLSCSKDSPPTTVASAPAAPTYQEENFFDGFLTATGFSQLTTAEINESFYEYGFEFIPLLNGKITSLRIKLPDPNNALRVTIWDMNGAILKTSIVNVPTINTVTTIDIADLDLIKNKKYCITMNSNDYYVHKKTDGTGIVYPVTVGNIKVLSNKYIAGATQTYPTDEPPTYCNGDLSFNFLRTE